VSRLKKGAFFLFGWATNKWQEAQGPLLPRTIVSWASVLEKYLPQSLSHSSLLVLHEKLMTPSDWANK
jgi:hypothetical protein